MFSLIPTSRYNAGGHAEGSDRQVDSPDVAVGWLARNLVMGYGT